MIAFLLNPLVRDLQRLRLPRGIAVALVFLIFATAVAFVALALGSVVADQTRSATARADDYVTVEGAGGKTGAEQDIDRLQHWLDTHRLERIQIQKQATDWADNLGAGEISKYTQDALCSPRGGVLDRGDALQPGPDRRHRDLHAARHGTTRAADRPPFPTADGPAADAADREGARELRPGAADPLDRDRPQRRDRHVDPRPHGARPGADKYALLFGVWTAVIEVIPYIGPWLSAVPPAIYALVVDPVSVFWVLALFVFIYQIEGHVVVPNVMATRSGCTRCSSSSACSRAASCTASPACCSRCRRWPPRARSGSSSRSVSSTTGTTTACPERGRSSTLEGVARRPG